MPANSPNDEIRRSLVLILKLNFKAAMEVNTIEINQKIVRRRLLLKIGCTGMFLGLAIGLSIPFMLTAILHLLGFGTKGIIPGSIAAEWQASLHNLTKGIFFSCKLNLIFHICLIFNKVIFTGCQKTGMKGLGGGIISACTIFIGVFGLIIGSCVAKCKKIADLPEVPDVGSGHLPVTPEVRIEEENDEDDLYRNNEENEAENERLELEHENAPLIQF